VLDPKAAQNLSILLGGALKHITYEELRCCILRCDTNVLTENLLQSLIQYIPAPDQVSNFWLSFSDKNFLEKTFRKKTFRKKNFSDKLGF
jgi:hypothetical protein